MKLVKDDVVYVQRNDIGFIIEENLSMPVSIFLRIYKDGIFFIDDSNRYEFLKFYGKKEIEFFKNLDWVIDYEDVKDLTVEEILEMKKIVSQEQTQVAKTIASNSEISIINSSPIDRYKALGFKNDSIKDILLFKQGVLSMPLPEGIDNSIEQQKIIKKAL